MAPKKPAFITRGSEIVDRYKANEDIASIATDVGVTPTTLVSWLKKLGAYDIGRRRLCKTRREEIIRLYLDETLPSGEIAKIIGVSRSSVSRIIKSNGLTRSNAESQAIRASREGVGFSRFGKKGAFHSRKNGCWFACDSAYEYARMCQLEEDRSIISWRRCEDRIPYNASGVDRIYVPDLVVICAGGVVRVEEIKPEKFFNKGMNPAKFAAASNFYTGTGIEFVVITEEAIGIDRIRQLDGFPLGEIPDDVRRAKRMESALRHLRKMTPEQRAEYNRKAREREARKRATDRDAYNRRAREYRERKKLKNKAMAS